jgi:hypothetical protein
LVDDFYSQELAEIEEKLLDFVYRFLSASLVEASS